MRTWERSSRSPSTAAPGRCGSWARIRRFPTLDPALPSVLVDLPTHVAFLVCEAGFRGAAVPVVAGDRTRPRRRGAAPRGAVPEPQRRLAQRARARAARRPGSARGDRHAHARLRRRGRLRRSRLRRRRRLSTRSRMLEFAVLRALGLRTSQLSAGSDSRVRSSWCSACSREPRSDSWSRGSCSRTSHSAPPGRRRSLRCGSPCHGRRCSGSNLALLGALVAVAAAQVTYVRRLRSAPILRGGEGAAAP